MALRGSLALLSAVPAVLAQQDDRLGPGAGPWTVATPESVGLSPEALRISEETVNDRVGGRVCYVVIKDGKIVQETYRGNGGVDSISEGYSTTKSQCSSLFGIAREQGWADPMDAVSSRNSGTRQGSPRTGVKVFFSTPLQASLDPLHPRGRKHFLR
jgi:CubicO group peptidase (beta-lactamase class C family)